MSLFILDTDHMTLLGHGDPTILAHLKTVPQRDRATTIISFEEQIGGWYSQLRAAKDETRLARAYEKLAETFDIYKQLRVLPFTLEAIRRYGNLRKSLPRLGRLDLAIAAIVLENQGTVVTRNRDDFAQVPGLNIEDWTKP